MPLYMKVWLSAIELKANKILAHLRIIISESPLILLHAWSLAYCKFRFMSGLPLQNAPWSWACHQHELCATHTGPACRICRSSIAAQLCTLEVTTPSWSIPEKLSGKTRIMAWHIHISPSCLPLRFIARNDGVTIRARHNIKASPFG